MERDAESDSSEKEIDRVCDAFEAAWRNEPRPSISDFVARGTAAQQSKLFYELLLVDLECRRKVGEQPSRQEYLRAYPQFSSQIEGVNFHYGARPLRQIVAARKTRLTRAVRRSERSLITFNL